MSRKGNPAAKGRTEAETMATFRALLRCFGLIRRVMAPHFQQYGVNAAQWGVLRTLAAADEAGPTRLRLGEIGDRLIIRPPSVSNIVKGLRHRELLEVRADEEDHRVRRASLTAAGRALVARVRESHGDRIRHLVGPLDEGEQRMLRSLLERLNAHLEEQAGP